jgi:hypothetical protein
MGPLNAAREPRGDPDVAQDQSQPGAEHVTTGDLGDLAGHEEHQNLHELHRDEDGAAYIP